MKNTWKKLSVLVACMFVMSLLMMSNAFAASALEKKCAAVVKAQTVETDTDLEKLEKLFQFVENTYGYARSYTIPSTKTQLASMASEILKKKNGSCYHFASVYAYLAKKATSLPVRVVIGQTNGFYGKWQPHAWTEVKIKGKWYVFDTNLDKFKENCAMKYFNKKSASVKKTFKKTKAVTIAF